MDTLDDSFTQRRLGPGGPVVGPLGVGTWALGGPFTAGPGCPYPAGAPLGYGRVDDAQSARALACALDLGARLFDTADVYGAGHAEKVLGRALRGRRDRVVVATKFGNTFDPARRVMGAPDATPDNIRRACEASLRRLGTDWIDLYQLHLGDLAPELFDGVAEVLEGLCADGLIRAYGWSTDDPARAALLAGRPGALAVQFDMNVFEDAPAMLATCAAHGITGIARLPLAMGFLSGKFRPGGRLADDDIRARPPDWLRYFEDGGGAAPDWTARLEAVREVLCGGGRTPAQGALAWIWARGEAEGAATIPIPGIRTDAQARENLGAAAFGPLTPDEMAEVDRLLGRA